MKQILMIASCLSVLLALSCTALGQDSMPGAFAMLGDGKSPSNNSLKAIDSILIDTSLLSVRYKACYWLCPGGSPTWHITVLHVGTSHSLFYDFAGHIKNRYAYIQLAKMDSLGPGHGVGVELEELKRELTEEYQSTKQKQLPDYPIFMAIAEQIGYDATGRKIAVNELDTIGEELKKFIEAL